jgi:hypothetical protein
MTPRQRYAYGHALLLAFVFVVLLVGQGVPFEWLR